jgi:hypothetical protein
VQVVGRRADLGGDEGLRRSAQRERRQLVSTDDTQVPDEQSAHHGEREATEVPGEACVEFELRVGLREAILLSNAAVVRRNHLVRRPCRRGEPRHDEQFMDAMFAAVAAAIGGMPPSSPS